MAAIVNRLRHVEGSYQTTADLIDYVYQGDEPEYAKTVIFLTIRKLKSLGFPIVAMQGRGSRGYRFMPLVEGRVLDLCPTMMKLVPGKLLAA